MSGHSHAKTIKHQKEITDQKRGQIFSKVARLISVATKEGGPNPDTNTRLRMAIEEARACNMPKENVERAIKRGSGETEGAVLENVAYEAYGPGGIAVLIEGITDNTNRALAEVKKVLGQHSGKMVGEGGIKWLFERKGYISLNLKSQPQDIQDREKLELLVIESGAEDICWREDELDVYTKLEDLEKVKRALEEKGVKIEFQSLDWKPKELVSVGEKEKEDCKKLFEELDELDSVQEIYSNLKT